MRLEPSVASSLRSAKDRLWEDRRADPHVHGVGIGKRQRGGRLTDEIVVVVFVDKKRPEAHLPRRRLLPRQVEAQGMSWGVDVVQGGPFRAGAVSQTRDGSRRARTPVEAAVTETFPAFPNLMRPPRQGVSISNLHDTEAGGKVAGTLGCYIIDNTDGTKCLLSCNHVIARENAGRVGDPIIQPGGYDGGTSADGIASLKRWVALQNDTSVDAAIATPDQSILVTDAVAGNLMAPISPTHQVVGMVVAGDAFGNNFLTRMDATCAALDVQPLVGPPPGGGDGALAAVVTPVIDMPIEKVGRTSGYSTGTIIGVGCRMKVATGSPVGTIHYDDLTWVQFFALPGDSGSVVCAGGDGQIDIPILLYIVLQLVLEEIIAEACPCLTPIDNYYKIPLAQHHSLADKLRDEVMSQSLVGRLLIATSYVNADAMKARLAAHAGSPGQPTEQAYAKTYYDKYQKLVTSVINDPSSTAVLTSSILDDILFIIDGEAQAGTLSSEEETAALALYDKVLVKMRGMNRKQATAYLNKPRVFHTVYTELSRVPTIELIGKVTTQEPPKV